MNERKKRIEKEVSHVSKTLETSLHPNDSSGKWTQAADDARLRINECRRRMRSLEKAVRTFEKYAKAGEPWPGEGVKVFGQDA